MGMGDEKYISLTTFTRDGRTKAGTESTEATAEVVSGADYEAVRDKGRRSTDGSIR